MGSDGAKDEIKKLQEEESATDEDVLIDLIKRKVTCQNAIIEGLIISEEEVFAQVRQNLEVCKQWAANENEPEI